MSGSSLVPKQARVAKVVRELSDVVTFHLDVEGGAFRFAPGQFTMLYAMGLGESAISISGDPDRPDQLVHTLRAVGRVTIPLAAVKPGDSIGVRGPYGKGWPLDEARGRDLVIVAGGIGLPPLRPAILHVLARRADYGRLVILYGARTPADILFRKELEQWRGRFDVDLEVTVDRAGVDWRGHVGVVPELIRSAGFDPTNAVAMMCGPEVMLRYASRALLARGTPASSIYVSLERNMKCAVGLCGHCQIGPAFVCKDGPVMPYDRAAPLLSVREL